MPNEPQEKENLSEMITFVVTPTMKRHLLAAASDSTVPYAVVGRWALQDWLNANGYTSPDQTETLEEVTES
jgi:hypothetical protein